MGELDKWKPPTMEQTTINLIDPVVGRHVPYYVNDNIIIENNVLLLMDQQSKQIFFSCGWLKVRLI